METSDQTKTNDTIYELLERCDKEKPKSEDVKALRHALAKAAPAQIKGIGDLAENNINKILSGKTYPVTSRELTKADINLKRKELGYETSPVLEQMIIDVLLLSWLRYQEFEYYFTTLDRDGMTLQKAAFWDKRLSIAQKRYLKACESLAKVRKLTSPIMQINLAAQGSQQLNVAGDLVKQG